MSINWIFDGKILPSVHWYNQDCVFNCDKEIPRFDDLKMNTKEIFSKLGLQKNLATIGFGSGTGSFAIEAAKRCSKVYKRLHSWVRAP